MKVAAIVVVVLLVATGYFGKPYIDMLSDGQPFGCVMDQIGLDIGSDGGFKDELARQSNAANCKAQAMLDKAKD